MRRRDSVRVRAARIRCVLAIAVLSLSACYTATAAANQRAHRSVASFTARGGIEQVQVTGLGPGGQATLVNRRGHKVGSQSADSLGGIVFRNVKPGRGYRVRELGANGGLSGPLTVLTARPAPPTTGIYSQTIPTKGYGYLTTRDGTQLAINVRLPAGNGPYPTVVEYSGYGYANPNNSGDSSISQIANLLGFAVVDVNMRGTGCSGGAFDFFDRPQSLDGYDVIETVARQPWVMHHKVGMMGISYGGISQLFVGATNPPSLSEIAPLSVIDSAATQLSPGGILNTGFTVAWARERDHDALPASATGGQPWALKQIQGGDQTCKNNQVLHGEAVNLIAKIRANPYYVPAVADPVSPIAFVNKIRSPVYMACQFTDEQTGGHCADLAEHFTGTRRKWFTFTNGTHIDSLDPRTFNRWYDFLELYVARQAPNLPSGIKSLAPVIFNTAMGVSGVTLPNDPIQGQPTYGDALNVFQALAPIRILFDNGAGSATPGAPYPGFEQSFARFPLPGTEARSWYLGRDGTLSPHEPNGSGADEFTWNPAARPKTDFTGGTSGGPGGIWTATPPYQWLQNPAGSALSYVSSPLSANTAVVGAGAVQAWIKASTPSVDLQVTVSEVRPDGKETFVQTGWLRASERKLDSSKSTLLEPVPTFREADVAPLPSGRFAKVTVPLYYEGHLYRVGSRIRITITAPGGDQPIWAFDETNPLGTASVTLTYSRTRPSRVVLPVVSGINSSTGLPPCPGLRGEPCRSYQPFTNRPG
jgi:predicted acyl esterase